MKTLNNLKPFKIILLAILFLNFSQKPYTNSLKTEKLKGKVNFYNEYTFKVANHFETIKKGEEYSSSFVMYNEEGNRIESHIYDTKSKLISKRIYKYQNKKPIKENQYKKDGSLEFNFSFKYDKNGNKIKSSEYNPDGLLVSEYVLKYNGKNELVKDYFYIVKSGELILTSKTLYKYKNGKKTEKKFYSPEEGFIGKESFTYNDKDDIVKKTYATKKGIITNSSFKYTYDEKGNWIKQITYVNGVAVLIKEREFKYYE